LWAGNVLLFPKKSRARMPPSSVTNGLADSCATITARRLEFFVVARRGRVGCFIGALLCPIDSAVLARGVLAEIPLFFWLVRPTIGIRGNKNFVGFPEIGV